MDRDLADQPYSLEKGTVHTRVPFKMVMDCLSGNELDHALQICTQHQFKPKLGQLLIASGRLSASDLDSMLIVHEHESIKDVPMAKLLVIAGLLSGDELNRYLELHRLLQAPTEQVPQQQPQQQSGEATLDVVDELPNVVEELPKAVTE